MKDSLMLDSSVKEPEKMGHSLASANTFPRKCRFVLLATYTVALMSADCEMSYNV